MVYGIGADNVDNIVDNNSATLKSQSAAFSAEELCGCNE